MEAGVELKYRRHEKPSAQSAATSILLIKRIRLLPVLIAAVNAANRRHDRNAVALTMTETKLLEWAFSE